MDAAMKVSSTTIGSQYDLEMGLVKKATWVQAMGNKEFEKFLLISLPCEVAEVLDTFKKTMDGRREFDRAHCIEELSDVLWSVSLIAQHIDCSIDEVMTVGMEKMRARYPERYALIANPYLEVQA